MAIHYVSIGDWFYGNTNYMDIQEITSPEFKRHVIVVAILIMSWWVLFCWKPKKSNFK